MIVPILVFHKIGPVPQDSRFPRNYVRTEQFDALLGSLKRAGYESVSLAQYVAYRRGEESLPRKPIVLTFDDGYRSNAEIAVPIMRKYGFTATIFVVAGRLGRTNDWDVEERQEPLLTADEVIALRDEGFSFGSHTVNHARLTSLSPDAALDELRASREALEALLGEPVRTICYPWAQHSDEVRRLAREAGYDSGVGIRRRLNRDETDVMALHRIPVTYLDSTWRIRWDLFRLRFRR
ncbi:MAG: polysaccharide deacetylase family protein [Gemmatimonadota bacterium]|nr:polysaccharide deacetylase family protein [Gemmatimonadota bacterium]